MSLYSAGMQGAHLYHRAHQEYKKAGDALERSNRACEGRSKVPCGCTAVERSRHAQHRAEAASARSPRGGLQKCWDQQAAAPVSSKVFARIRPLAVSGKHAEAGKGKHEHKYLAGHTVSSLTVGGFGGGSTTFDFPSAVLGETADQGETYDTVCRQLVTQFISGYNTLLFAYGQAGTGKTFTLVGPVHPQPQGSECHHAARGMFPRACEDIFAAMNHHNGVTWSLHASAIDFHMMHAYDLLADDLAPVTLGADHKPANLNVERLHTADDVRLFLERLRRQDDNVAHSERSHTVLVLTLRQVDVTSGKYRKSTLNCVELAGAERPDKEGTRRLTALDALILASEGKRTAGARSAIINYELSMLRTDLVRRNQFGCFQRGRQMVTPAVEYLIGLTTGSGQALVSAIICLSPASQNGWETWFACTCGEDFSRLSAPLMPERSRDVVQYTLEITKTAAEATKKAQQTPECGPASKFFMMRQIAAQYWNTEAELLRQLLSNCDPVTDPSNE